MRGVSAIVLLGALLVAPPQPALAQQPNETDIHIQGNVIQLDELCVPSTGIQLDFGTVVVGESRTDSVTITNTGPWHCSAIAIANAITIVPNDGSIVMSGYGTILSGQSRQLNISWTPKTDSTPPYDITVRWAALDPNTTTGR